MSATTADKTRLLTHAHHIAKTLKQRGEGTSLRITVPQRVTTTETDGWRAVIGHLGEGGPALEIWLDRFTRPDEPRRFYACFFSVRLGELTDLARHVARQLRPHRTFTSTHIANDVHCSLRRALPERHYNVPILESYRSMRRFFYGIYDSTTATSAKLNQEFCDNAAAFFESVARTAPGAAPEPEEREVYPQIENRTSVKTHLQRERSRLLALERKRMDGFTCQICGFNFERVYGRLGKEFAESHHRVPLNQLKGSVRTRLEDLITVCANCHRMLHRMSGRRNDAARLSSLVTKLTATTRK